MLEVSAPPGGREVGRPTMFAVTSILSVLAAMLPSGVLHSDAVKLTVQETSALLSMPHELGRLTVALSVERPEQFGLAATYNVNANTMPWGEDSTDKCISLTDEYAGTIRYALLGLIASETNIATC